ncbi:sugar phosphate nucleotidyltransferase [Croceiramulus getboli]|nr:sugar phosphate nucleotidyltransferase [Flavobacteriaceae bacterium YJPT1-3]
MTTSLIILAGGASTRMKKSTGQALDSSLVQQANARSKALIHVGDHPMLDYLLYQAKQGGISRVFIVTGPDAALFKAYFGQKDRDNSYHGLQINFATQHIPQHRSKPWGTADAVFQTMDQYPELQRSSFLVCNCDNLYSEGAFHELIHTTEKHALISYDRQALQFPESRIARFALLNFNEKDELLGLVEKPELKAMSSYKQSDGSFRVSMNIFKFQGEKFWPFVKNCPVNPLREEKELPSAIEAMIAQGITVKGLPRAEHVPDLTAKEDILQMKSYLSNHMAKLNW